MQPSTMQDARYESIDPDSIDATDDLDDDLARKPLREPEKIAITRSRTTTFGRILPYLLPVGLSLGILQLSFRNVYWRGTSTGTYDSPYSINEVLNILQIVAKTHELLIIASLSHLVLYYLRQQLSTNGLSFGLFTSTYQVTVGSHPFSHGFWQTCKSLIRRKTFQWRALILVLLIVAVALFGIVVGPASAIAVIPRLDWWHYHDLLSLYEHAGDPRTPDREYKLYIPKQLFPLDVNNSSLPGPYCLDSALDVNRSCPFAGFDELLRVFDVTGLPSDNVTISDPMIDTGLSRRLATLEPVASIPAMEAEGKVVSQIKAWTQNQVLANYLSLGWQSGISDDAFTVETQLQGKSSVLSPLVNVSCEMESYTKYMRNLSFFSDPYNFGDGNPLQIGSFDIRTIWNETMLANSSKTQFEWKELFGNTSNPVFAAFILSPSEGNETTNNVTMCGVEARWDTIDMWFMSNGAETIASNFTWDTTTGPPPGQDSVFPVARIHKEWADSLNAASGNSTMLVDLIDNAMQVFQKLSGASGSRVHAQAKILSMAVADGLARIGAEYNVNYGVSTLFQGADTQAYNTYNSTITLCRNGWCSQGSLIDDLRGPAILNGTVERFREYFPALGYGYFNTSQQLLHSFPEPADIATSWTQVSFPVKRYGYGWGFDTVAVKIATAILILHAVAVIAHCCYIMYSGLKYSFIDSLGDLVALALVSEPPVPFQATSVGVARGSTWSQSTAIREVGGKEFGASKLALVVGEDPRNPSEKTFSHRRPVVGRAYE